MAMLEIQNIHKSFRTYDEKSHFHIGPFPRGHARRVIRTLDVLRGVDLTVEKGDVVAICLLYTSPSPRDLSTSRMPSSA